MKLDQFIIRSLVGRQKPHPPCESGKLSRVVSYLMEEKSTQNNAKHSGFRKQLLRNRAATLNTQEGTNLEGSFPGLSSLSQADILSSLERVWRQPTWLWRPAVGGASGQNWCGLLRASGPGWRAEMGWVPVTQAGGWHCWVSLHAPGSCTIEAALNVPQNAGRKCLPLLCLAPCVHRFLLTSSTSHQLTKETCLQGPVPVSQTGQRRVDWEEEWQ